MTKRLSIMSAGAAESLILRLCEDSDSGIDIDASFGAVGATRDAFLSGAPCDLFVTSARVMSDLQASGQLDAESVGNVGWVQTGLATRAGEPVPDISTPEAVADALRAAPEIYIPDSVRSTAGIHLSTVLQQVGIEAGGSASLHSYPNGATAMRALADKGLPGALGGTQVTEILQTEGVAFAGPLPRPFDLVTLYQCALLRKANGSGAAQEMYRLLTGVQSTALREELGLRQSG